MTNNDAGIKKQKSGVLDEQRFDCQQIAEALVAVQDREKKEIGERLAENISQILSAGVMYIDMALRQQFTQFEMLKKGQRHFVQAITEINELSKKLITPTLDDLGLREAMLELVRGANHAAKEINFKIKIEGLAKRSISRSIKLIIFQILQECVNNILKHSGATIAAIQVNLYREAVHIIICDDGIGFNQKKKTSGLGLRMISNRVWLCHGKVSITSSSGKGTTIDIQFPLLPKYQPYAKNTSNDR